MMKLTRVAAVALVLLGASASLAQIGNNQGFLTINGNGAALVGGSGAVDSTNINTVGQYQQNQDAAGFVRSIQAQNGGLVQAAGIGGIGDFSVGQSAGVGGGQNQFYDGNPSSLGINAQNGGIALGQAVGTGPGAFAGLAFGLQQGYLNQFQIIVTPFGTNVNAAPVSASVFDAVGN
jgi:hypothetical protein